MKVVKKPINTEGYVLLDVTATTAEVSEALNAAGLQFCHQMGIRPVQGKSIAQTASEQMGIKDLDAVVSTQAIEALVPQCIEKSGIVPAFTPKPKPKDRLRRGHTFSFEIEVMPKPTYELESYDPVSFTVQPYHDDESVVDQEISKLASTYTNYVATDDQDHPLAKGDHCKLKIVATKDGEEVTGLSTDGRTYSVGAGLMPDGFDEGVVGMTVGETRTITFEGPDLDENNNVVEEEYVCTVTLLELQKEVAPIIDDEWVVANMPMYKSLEQLRADISLKANEQNRKMYQDYIRNTAAGELAKRFKGSIPDPIYEGAIRDLDQDLHRQAAQMNMTWEKFAEQNGGEQQMQMMMMMQVRNQLVQGFALDALYRHFGLTSTSADIDEVCASMDPRQPRRLRESMERAGFGYALRESAERLSAVKYLVDHADIKYVDPDAANEDNDEAETPTDGEQEA